ncbi:MAG: PAS domain S-box protein [Candidatus Latescibacteria bacterium]|jgi:PAS domain S-box-containing protein|nr:PAS domain S-box protein [Candidatus Latescibacterota bacterium]
MMQHLKSLRGKLLVFAFGIITAITGLSLVVLQAFVSDHVESQIEKDLERTQLVFESFMMARTDWLQAQCEVVAEDPRFTAPLDIINPEFDYQARTVLREARKFQRIIGSDLFMVTNHQGRVLARLTILPLPQQADNALLRHLSTHPSELQSWEYEGHTYHTLPFALPNNQQLLMGFDTPNISSEEIQLGLQSMLQESNMRLLNLNALTRQLMETFDSDLVAVINTQGQIQEALIRKTSYGADLSQSPKIKMALGGTANTGLQTDRDQIAQFVIMPVWVGNRVIGTLSVGFGIDDWLASNLNHMTDSEVSFGLNNHIIASTWPPNIREALNAQLAQRETTSHENTFRTHLNNEEYVSIQKPLTDLDGNAKGFYLLQFSYDKAIEFLITIEKLLAILGVSVLVLTMVISFVGFRKITDPLRALVDGTKKIADGHLETQITPTTQDEIGELAQSFNEMTYALKDSLDALSKSERRYRDLFDNAQDIVYTTDIDMQFTSLNKAAQTLLGKTEAELIGTSIYDLMPTEEAKRVKFEEHLIIAGTVRPTVEFALQCKGEKRQMEVVSRWMISAENKPIGVHGIGRDVQERKERDAAEQHFREQLHQAEKLRVLGEMAAGVAHNFNNLLTSVLGYAELMTLNKQLPENVRSNAEKIVDSGRRCSDIVRRIQTFGRPIDLTEIIPMDLNTIIQETIDITQPRWKTRPEREGIAIEIKTEFETLPFVRSTASAWEEVISNLIFNAVDAMPLGGTITLSTQSKNEEVILTVRDNGTGMDAEIKARVFEPFFSTKDADRGTGLGLSTVWALVQNLGGRVELKSEWGEGTEFTIYIPTSAGNLPTEDETIELASDLQILLIDEDTAVRDFLPQLLQSHRVDTESNSTSAMNTMETKNYDVIITDWTMSGTSGLDMIEHVKHKSPQTVTVLMTGWEIKNSIVENHPDIDLTLSKPFDQNSLNQVLSKAHQIRQKSLEPNQVS